MPPIKITTDGTFDLATGSHRYAKTWKNTSATWSELVTRLSTTHRTAETLAEYLKAKKARQDEIKDIGGFVGGHLTGGRRKAGNVLHRQLITLDIDFAKAGLWEDFCLLYDNAAVVYSTHKHSPEAPRLRLIIPLDRPVAADEYIAIARRVAGHVGIEAFDHTTYEPNRLMYWPSTAKDGEYEFRYQDGPWLAAGDILGSYHDWRDSSEWPVSSRESETHQRAIKKQGDPLEKPGIVGAFCRTYGIEEAIDTFLADAYEACDVEGRYTFREGSTAAGLVVYEDKYAFSHHGTDPISGKLCNAFDLVRLHKFGLKDEDAREGTPVNRLPSYVDMTNFVMQDARVRKLIVTEKLSEAHADFGDAPDLPEGEEPTSDEWKGELKVDSKGNVLTTYNNILLILENDPGVKDAVALDTFLGRPVVRKNLPWRPLTPYDRWWSDYDKSDLLLYLEKRYDIKAEGALKVSFTSFINKKAFHPVREYLDGLVWDGERRVESLFIEYMGAADTPYTRAVTRKTLAAAVARIYEPGIKFDNVLTLVGEEDRFKSTLLKELGGDWFSDAFSFHMLKNSKEPMEQMAGFWIVEIAELTGINKSEAEAMKSFLSRQKDVARMAFKEYTSLNFRQCIFFGTTNRRDFLREASGNRRFWPVEIEQGPITKNVKDHLTAEERNQVWAEAAHMWRSGEPLYLNSELKAAAKLVQLGHTSEHPWAGLIAAYLDTKLPEDWAKLDEHARRQFLTGDDFQTEGTTVRDRVCVLEIWCEALQKPVSAIDERSEAAIRSIMRSSGDWREETKPMKFGRYGLQRRGYFKVTKPVTKPHYL